jgi:hypothetical protein
MEVVEVLQLAEPRDDEDEDKVKVLLMLWRVVEVQGCFI